MSYPSNPQPTRPTSTRWFLSLVTVSLGGYLLVLSLGGQFIQLFTGMRFEISLGVLLVLQLLFALAVVAFGFFVAPAPLPRRVIAKVIIVGAVIIVAILQDVRLSIGFGPASVFFGFTFADVFVMLTLALGAGWLVVRSRPAIAYAFLALIAVVALVHWAMVVNGVDSAAAQLVMLILSALVVAGIGWGGVIASRMVGSPSSGGPRAPVQQYAHQQPQQHNSPAQLQSPYTQQNDRPAERGPVI